MSPLRSQALKRCPMSCCDQQSVVSAVWRKLARTLSQAVASSLVKAMGSRISKTMDPSYRFATLLLLSSSIALTSEELPLFTMKCRAGRANSVDSTSVVWRKLAIIAQNGGGLAFTKA